MRASLRLFLLVVLLGTVAASSASAQNPFLRNRGKRTIERIEFRGARVTREYVLRRQLGFAEGDAFDPELVTSAQERLEHLPFVGYVQLTVDRLGPDRVAVIFEVVEEARFSWAPGIEYSRRHGKKLVYELQMRWENLSGRGERLQLDAYTWGRNGARLTWSNPWILDDLHLGVFVQGTVEGYDWLYAPDPGAEYFESGARGGLWRDFDYGLSVLAAGGFRHTRFDDLLGVGLSDDEFELTLAVEHDSRDARFYPTHGVHARVEQHVAGLGSDFGSYSFTDLTLSAFAEVPWLRVAAGNLQARLAQDALPLYERAYVGGPMSVRGVDFGVVSGDQSLLASLELRRSIAILPLREGRSIGLGVHAFHDWGKAWDEGESFDAADLRWSYGLGVHFNLNTRNYRIEWAHTDDGDEVWTFEDRFRF